MLKQMKVKPSIVKVDYRYQRPTDEKRVDTIAANYDPLRVGVPVLSQRSDGSLWYIDGAHRGAAIVKAGQGETPILCLVHEGLTIEEEAGWFVILNGDRVAVDVMSKYRARLIKKEPVAVEIHNIAKSKGLAIGFNHGAKTISAIAAVEWVHARKGNLAAVLDVLVPWALIDERGLDGMLIKAVAIFLAQYTEADPSHLSKRLMRAVPVAVLSALKPAKRDYPGWVAACLVLRSHYNKGTKKPLAPLNW